MKTARHPTLLVLLSALLAGWSSAQAVDSDRSGIDEEFPAGPVSPYYLTAGEQGFNWAVQFDAVILNWAQHHSKSAGEYAIAVSGDVRVLGANFEKVINLGSRYTLGGVYTGTDYPYPVAHTAFWDGATDGVFNYSVDYRGGGVYQFDSN